jgi:polar amino acid transport system substrate-binding protein
MYYEAPNKLGRLRTNAIAPRSLPTELAATERSTVDMERVSENFRRLSAERMGTMGDRKVRRKVEAALRKLFGAALILAIGTVFVPADATAQSPIACGTAYTVARGDTLFKIARRAFGNGNLYKQIFEANRHVLPNSASVEIGNEILIPCLDSSGKAVRKDGVARKSLAEPVNSEAAGPVTSEPQLVIPRVRLLTGSDIAPYADQILPQGGMITDLVSRALNAAVPGQQSRVAFVNDWASHLNYLLPEGAFDVSFPWYKPDCSKADKLNAEMQSLCAEFEFSNPIFEIRVGFYTQTGSALVETGTLAALSGKRLCRPSGHVTFDLERIGLVKPDISIETQYTAKECFVRLVKGQVDVVTLDKSEADKQLRQLGIAKEIIEIGDLESVQTLHALVSKQNPNGLAHLELINRGLAELMASGKWFEVVAFHQGWQLALMN